MSRLAQFRISVAPDLRQFDIFLFLSGLIVISLVVLCIYYRLLNLVKSSLVQDTKRLCEALSRRQHLKIGSGSVDRANRSSGRVSSERLARVVTHLWLIDVSTSVQLLF